MLYIYYLKRFFKYIILLNFFYYKVYILTKYAYNKQSFFFLICKLNFFKKNYIKQKKK